MLSGYLDEGGDQERLAACYLLMLDLLTYPDSAATRAALDVAHEGASPAERFWIGVATLEHGRRDEVRRIAREMEEMDADGVDADAASGLARALILLDALDRGDEDAVEELADIQRTLRDPVDRDPNSPAGPEPVCEWLRLRLAEALVERGDARLALRYLESLPTLVASILDAPSILLSGAAHEALADTAAAQAAYTRFLRW